MSPSRSAVYKNETSALTPCTVATLLSQAACVWFFVCFMIILIALLHCNVLHIWPIFHPSVYRTKDELWIAFVFTSGCLCVLQVSSACIPVPANDLVSPISPPLLSVFYVYFLRRVCVPTSPPNPPSSQTHHMVSSTLGSWLFLVSTPEIRAGKKKEKKLDVATGSCNVCPLESLFV